jgi:hypothetical protein
MIGAGQRVDRQRIAEGLHLIGLGVAHLPGSALPRRRVVDQAGAHAAEVHERDLRALVRRSGEHGVSDDVAHRALARQGPGVLVMLPMTLLPIGAASASKRSATACTPGSPADSGAGLSA